MKYQLETYLVHIPVNWTCRQIRPNPILFRTASAKEIDIMDANEFLDCLEIIGNISNMHRWQHKRLYLKAVKVFILIDYFFVKFGTSLINRPQIFENG
jgi:hypothetical protein